MNPPHQVAVIVGVIGAALYPTVVVPLQIAYGGRERPARPSDAPPRPGFKKGGVWREIEGRGAGGGKEGE